MTVKWTEQRIIDVLTQALFDSGNNRFLEFQKIAARALIKAGAIRTDDPAPDPGPWVVLAKYDDGWYVFSKDFPSINKALESMERDGRPGVDYRIVSIHRKLRVESETKITVILEGGDV